MKDERPLFISFEGIDGTGKSTQARRLSARIDALLTNDPKGTEFGQAVTDAAILDTDGVADGWPMAFSFLAARAALTQSIILPAMREGRSVISDRYYDSTICYQGILGGLDRDVLKELSLIASRQLVPDITFVLVFHDMEQLRNRIIDRAYREGRVLDRFDAMPTDSMERLQNGFLTLASEEPERLHVLYCDGMSEAEVEDMILADLEATDIQ